MSELTTPDLHLLAKISYAFAKKQLILPLRDEGESVVAAIADPLNLQAIEELEMLVEKPVRCTPCSKDLLLAKLQELYRSSGESATSLLLGLKETGAQSEEIESYDLLDEGQLPPIVRALNLVLREAIVQGASDVHFEPQESGLRIRYRIDGVLQNRHAPASEHQSQLLARIKVMARLDIAEHRLPQDGRIKLKMGGREIDFRVSTVPVTGGERIVLRILDKGNVVLGLDKSSMPESILSAMRKLIRLPEGILLVTGPTGSGKTTTLYSALSEVSSDEINIMTIEDPVEYKLAGIAQIGVRPKIGLDFAAGLRHILRQDPDVVMVGEIRDRETAEIAIQAALTGHLVLSTLHTNDAPSALTRLVDMGIEPYLLSSSIIGVLAQRLVRTICPHCKRRYTATPGELHDVGLEGRHYLHKGQGCESCFGSGYKGRCGIYELMPLSTPLKAQLARSADALLLRRLAIEEGMTTLAKSGQELVAAGLTTVAEVLRVTRGIEEQ